MCLSVSDQAWAVAGVGDYDGDRVAAIFWRNRSTGMNVIWKSANAGASRSVTGVTDLAWKVVP